MHLARWIFGYGLDGVVVASRHSIDGFPLNDGDVSLSRGPAGVS